jgi:hypothetical protein
MEEQPSVQEVPTFDPSKEYKWTIDTEFTLTGSEFAMVMNAFRAVLATEEAQRIMTANKAAEAMEAVLGKAVEEGRVIPKE